MSALVKKPRDTNTKVRGQKPADSIAEDQLLAARIENQRSGPEFKSGGLKSQN